MIVPQQNAKLHYECIGTGQDVLLIHGWASSGSMWARLAADLCADYRFWLVDLPGFGASPVHGTPLDIDGHARALAAFCVEHGIQPFAVFGHSMGGMIALNLLALQPVVAQRLVLVAPVVTGRFASDISVLVASDVGRYALTNAAPLWALAQSQMLSSLLPRALHINRQTPERVIRDFRRMNWSAAAHLMSSAACSSMLPHLAHITQRALVVVGKWDYTVPPDEGRLAAQHLLNATLLEMDDTYHQPLDEHPERFVTAVYEFLQS